MYFKYRFCKKSKFDLNWSVDNSLPSFYGYLYWAKTLGCPSSFLDRIQLFGKSQPIMGMLLGDIMKEFLESCVSQIICPSKPLCQNCWYLHALFIVLSNHFGSLSVTSRTNSQKFASISIIIQIIIQYTIIMKSTLIFFFY